MMTLLAASIATIVACNADSDAKLELTSPDGHIAVRCALGPAGELSYAISLDGRTVLEPSPLGFEANCGSWTSNLTWVKATAAQKVSDSYRLAHGKRRVCQYEAIRATAIVCNEMGIELRIVFQVSNDGVAIRYLLPACGNAGQATIAREATGYDFPATTRAWLMPMDPANSGWSRVHPCYEGRYSVDIPVTMASPTGVGWAYPALFHVPDTAWVWIAESDVNVGYCATRLSSPTEAGLYCVMFPDPGENNHIGAAEPEVSIPFTSPWRVIIVGKTLGAIVESTLITDLATPSRVPNDSFVKPGRSTWSWLREKDSATVFDRQRDYVDLAARLGFEYCLVDALWDTQIGYDRIAELTRYADERGVGILLWYNSNGNWNDAPQTPINRMHTHQARTAEFERIGKLGVKGVKVDFFGGDKQATMRLYMDILKDAAAAGMLVNFHGATVPRGWERTWPNLMATEAVRGYEYCTFEQADADRAPPHCCIVPFTRNVIGPMDFTPTCLGKFLNPEGTIERRTTPGFELALSVLFESGIQHFGLTPDDVANAPDFVVDLLRSLPPTWDDIHFVDGFPARFVVVARRAGDRWFISGINGQDQPQAVACDLRFIGKNRGGILIEDGDTAQELKRRDVPASEGVLKLTMTARGGFVFRSTN